MPKFVWSPTGWQIIYLIRIDIRIAGNGKGRKGVGWRKEGGREEEGKR